jgi:tetraacyldisaccharide 4'-kinase
MRQFGATVMVLDDGFQHLSLGREVDLVLMPASDLDDEVLPSGRLREPLDCASSADCLLVPGSDEDVSRVSAAFDRMPVFRVVNRYERIRSFDGSVPAGSRVVAVAGIARPERFFAALRDQGCEVVRTVSFPDHHWYSGSDLDRIRTVARESGADLVVTTEKDAVRMTGQPGPTSPAGAATSWAVLPMMAVIEPADLFVSWLRDRL